MKRMKKKLFPTLLLAVFALLFSQAGTRTPVKAAIKDNLPFTLNTIDGGKVSTTAVSGQTTVLVFGTTQCSRTSTTLLNIADSSWVHDPDIRVIFVEHSMAPQYEVQAYSQKFNCDKITFCYNETDIHLRVLSAYTGTNGGKTPTVILIDQDDKIQSILSGTQTAAVIRAEIDKFTGAATPTTAPERPVTPTGIENLDHIFTSIKDQNVRTRASESDQATILIFSNTSCGRTKTTLQSIAKSQWIHDPTVRVVFAEYDLAPKDAVSDYAQQFNCDEISFCYDVDNYSDGIRAAMFKYLKLFQEDDTHVSTPFTILIDKNNRIRKSWQGPLSAETLKEEIDRLPKPTVPDTTLPVSIANVSRLQAASDTKSIKLSWKKVKNADGYIVYQYSNSKWNRKAAVSAGKTSYNVTGLQPGSNYRFAVRAYMTKDKKQTLSSSYTSLYTATRPASVNFKVTAGKNRATLKWNKVTGATGYKVYYKTSSKASWKLLKTTKGTNFTKKGLRSRKTYTFTVKAYKTYKGKTYTAAYKAKKATIR